MADSHKHEHGQTASPEHNPTINEEEEDDDETKATYALPLSASLILDSLPQHTSTAAETAGEIAHEKVTIKLIPLGNARTLATSKFRCGRGQKFEAVVNFVRRRLDVQAVHCYVNSAFAPAMDEGVGGLWRCFNIEGELRVHYSIAPAFG
ncbi:APG12-domain-containing protein [Piedraia hortae CBS 480.64]|uniref:Ubiquitin-like protein ATG12 n=1 Tax=Piedraia hortae CBS 480.64 TaxID=1314780 RepID=A0A6A7BVA0_9PEZI|nr:APG12-domain-containing protein [Piedraia hortae CBS 480.64]